MKPAFALVLFLFIAGCGGGSTSTEPRTFDLGLDAPGIRIPGVRVGGVRAIAPFELNDMLYRLAYRNAAEVAAYAASRWAATPAEMFRKQLQRVAGDGPAKCVLEVEIQEFSQVFSAKEASDVRIEMRAALLSGGRPHARQFIIVEGNAGADAVSGAAAFARAANRAINEIGGWAAVQSDCR